MWLFRACQVWRSYPTTTPHSTIVGPVLHTSWLAYQLHSSRSELRQQLSLHCFQLVACCFSFCSLRRATCTTSLVASSLPPCLPPWLHCHQGTRRDRVASRQTDRNIASAALPLCSESNILPTSCRPDYSKARGTFLIGFFCCRQIRRCDCK